MVRTAETLLPVRLDRNRMEFINALAQSQRAALDTGTIFRKYIKILLTQEKEHCCAFDFIQKNRDKSIRLEALGHSFLLLLSAVVYVTR